MIVRTMHLETPGGIYPRRGLDAARCLEMSTSMLWHPGFNSVAECHMVKAETHQGIYAFIQAPERRVSATPPNPHA